MVVGEIPTQVHCYLVKHAADRLSHTNNVDTTKTITHVSLCAGYGGIDLGLGRAIPNLRTIAFSEIEAFACANLVSKMEAGLLDAAPIWTNLKTFPWSDFRDRVGVLSGGYPCQPFSAAGKRLGKEDPRHLWPWIADGIAAMRPRIVFFENVEGHISLGLREVIEDLERLGYNSTWGIFSAREVGAPHQRKRVFILANDTGERLSLSYGQRNEPEGQRDAEFECCGHNAWPSRPGEAQHGWEPPRVVGDSQYDGLFTESILRGDEETSDQRSKEESQQAGQPKRADRPADVPSLQGCTSGSESVVNSESWSNGQQQTQQQGWDTSRGSSEEGRDMGNTTKQGLPFSGGECGTVQQSRSEQESERSDESMAHTHGTSSGSNRKYRGQLGLQPKGGANRRDERDTERTENGICQAQPSMGGDADGAADWMDNAELYVTTDNRTDELRLLGNGVVPATAERAFRVLLNQILNQ